MIDDVDCGFVDDQHGYAADACGEDDDNQHFYHFPEMKKAADVCR